MLELDRVVSRRKKKGEHKQRIDKSPGGSMVTATNQHAVFGLIRTHDMRHAGSTDKTVSSVKYGLH